MGVGAWTAGSLVKTPVVEAPVPVAPVAPAVEVEVEKVEDSQPEVVQPEGEKPVEEVVQENELDPSLEYADAVNNAVALLTGDEQAIEAV